jgi:hypothetical protein
MEVVEKRKHNNPIWLLHSSHAHLKRLISHFFAVVTRAYLLVDMDIGNSSLTSQ